eukprot:9288626-Alexandrium_andersonii.AAC.1
MCIRDRSRTLRRRPNLWKLDTAWPTVSSRGRPLRRTGRARIARELRSFNTRAVSDVSEPFFARKQ